MQPVYTPRPATIDDITSVAKIESYSNIPPWSEQSFRNEFQKKGSNFWVLTDDESDTIIYGYVVFSFLENQAHIQTLAVDRKFRRRGYASSLVRFAINFVLRQGGKSVYLEVRKSNISALALYQQLGFVVVRTIKGMYSDGEDAYAMLFKVKAEADQSKMSFDSDPSDEAEDGSDRDKNFN
jgi:ribosomal-protein-alanine N-acetyltransferase